MKQSFKTLLSKITGISTPVFGISWTPPRIEKEIAETLISFLEDRRVLYHLYDWTPLNHNIEGASIKEYPQVIKSVLEIRDKLTQLLEKVSRDSPLAKSLQSMRAACRKFLNNIDTPELYAEHLSLIPLFQVKAMVSLGEMRAIFGMHVAIICTGYGVDIEEGTLQKILPPDDEEDNSKIEKRARPQA